MSKLFEAWDSLSVQGELGDSYVGLRLPEVRAAPTYAARSVTDELEAIIMDIRTQSLPSNPVYPEAHGFSVSASMKEPGRNGRTRLLVKLTDGRYRDLFHALAEDVITKLVKVDTEKDAASLFITRLTKWQSFMRKHGVMGLSREERHGLIGELFLLRDYLLGRCDQFIAIASWKGCRGANHDFQFRLGCIEVKTTSSSSPHAFHVSNIRQLDSPGQGQLYIFLVLIEESEAGDASLPEMIDSLRDHLEGAALEAFEDSLVEAGYLEHQREIYSSPRYSLIKDRFFRVDDNFPRLREDLLPQGVEGVHYQVAIAACTTFEASAPEVLDTVLGLGEEVE
ncbi:MAG: PD-(D/E)XK motif protein [Prochlorococcaceae cyanobacterium]